MIKDLLNDSEQRMEKAIENLRREFASLRAGRANPSLLDKVMVDYYGVPTPINQTANISCPDPRMILVQPWDKSLIPAIERAIMKADLGLNPNSDGTVLRINIPQLTEERRKELVKTAGKKSEEAKVAVRNIRRDVNDGIKALEKNKEVTEDEAKNGLDDVQKTTDKFIQKIDEMLKQKEKDIMEV